MKILSVLAIEIGMLHETEVCRSDSEGRVVAFSNRSSEEVQIRNIESVSALSLVWQSSSHSDLVQGIGDENSEDKAKPSCRGEMDKEHLPF